MGKPHEEDDDPTPSDSGGREGYAWSLPDWESRLADARRKRALALAERDAASAENEAASEKAVSLNRRLALARQKREAALAEGVAPPRDDTAMRARDVARALRRGEAADTIPADAAPRAWRPRARIVAAASLAIGIAVLAGGLWWTTAPGSPPREGVSIAAAPLETTPRPARRPLVVPGDTPLDIVLIAGEGADLSDLSLGEGTFEMRSTPFRIERSMVQFFHDTDEATARRVAERLSAETLDLRGLRPSPPEGQLIVYVARRGG